MNDAIRGLRASQARYHYNAHVVLQTPFNASSLTIPACGSCSSPSTAIWTELIIGHHPKKNFFWQGGWRSCLAILRMSTTTPPALPLIGARRCIYIRCERRVVTTALSPSETVQQNLERRAQSMASCAEDKNDDVVEAHDNAAIRSESTVR